MRNILKSSSKLGLIAAVLLLASACSDDAQRNDDPAGETASPLVKIQEIEAGDECEHGGTMIINGIDEDEDGELSESEIKSRTPICKDAPSNGDGGDGGDGGGTPEAPANTLIKTEDLDVGDADCPAGGQRVLAGPDKNDDGQLSADEVTSTTLLCAEVSACSGATPLKLVKTDIEKDEYYTYQIGLEYEVYVELNQPINPERVKLHDATGVMGSGPLDYEVDEENDHIAILKWAPTQEGGPSILAVIEDGCSMAAERIYAPYASKPQTRVRVSSEKKGFLALGDKVEVCWTSRNADTCTLSEFGAVVETIETDGCLELTLTQEHIDDSLDTMNYHIRCDAMIDGESSAHTSSVPLYKAPLLKYFSATQPTVFDEDGGTATLSWDSFGMEFCKLSYDGDTIDVADEVPHDEPYSVEITETTDFKLLCEDASNEVYKSTVRYVVGPGIQGVWANLNVVNSSLGFAWTTINIDGTCDFKYSNNGHSLEYTNQTQSAGTSSDGVHTRYTNILKQNVDVSVFDFTKEQVLEVTCYDAGGTNSYTITDTI